MSFKVDIVVLDSDMDVPKYATEGSAGFDLCSSSKENIVLSPLERKIVKTGIKIALPVGCEAQVRPRSGLSIKHGITVINAPGTIDSDYRGEIMVPLINLGQEDFVISYNMRIAQMIISRFETVDFNIVSALDETLRGEGGFGSTGV